MDTIAKKHKTILVTPRTEFAKGVNYCSAIGVFRRLHNADVDMIPANEVVERKGDIVVLRNVYTGKTSEISGVKTLLWSSPRHARGEMASQIQEKGIRVEMIGDSVAPRNLLCAIHEGRAVAMRY